MDPSAYSSLGHWFEKGPRAPCVLVTKSVSGILNMLEAVQPAGDMSVPAVPDFVLYQDLQGGSRVSANHGAGHFEATTEKGGFVLAAPDLAISCAVANPHHIRTYAFHQPNWQDVLDEAGDRRFSFDGLDIFRGALATPAMNSALRKLWSLCTDEGAPSRLLARAAGCEILAELCRLGGAPLATAKGGLAPWAERRCIEYMRTRFAEDINLDDLAAEARLSPFHFARMFKHSVGVPPRVYLTRLRMERVCELLEHTDLPVTEIARDVGYSSSQALSRVFRSHCGLTPSDYRRAVRDPIRAVEVQ